MLIDTHCHLDFPEFDLDRDDVVARAAKVQVGCIINVGSSLEGSRKSVELSRQYPGVYAVVGIHPHEADEFKQEDAAEIKKLAQQEKVVAIGEIGLDYFKNFSKSENQRPLFVSLVNTAQELGLPLVIHSREASIDTINILKEAMPVRAVVHCFSGDADFLKNCLDLGFYVSFTCNVTYPKAQGLRDLMKTVPLDRIMLETDAPYLSPQELRGKRNEPANVAILAREAAGIMGLNIDKLAEATTANAKKFFGIE
ncbi:MAG: TatD family hydrolase [Candidatus Omnitrophota bacterium]|nr:TatD family hydrolase [Candidatus Omnitrophota bacterium]